MTTTQDINPNTNNIGIYKITNLITGQLYIGQTRNLKARQQAYSRLQCYRQPKIYQSIKRYGWEQHKFEIVLNCEIPDLNKFEFEIHQAYYSENSLNMLNLKIAWRNIYTYFSQELIYKIKNMKNKINFNRKDYAKLVLTEKKERVNNRIKLVIEKKNKEQILAERNERIKSRERYTDIYKDDKLKEQTL